MCESLAEERIASPEGRHNQGYQIQWHLFLLCLVTSLEEADDCLETSNFSKRVEEIRHLAEDNVLPVRYDILDDFNVNLFLVSAVSLLEIDVSEGICDRLICDRDLRLVVQKVVLEATVAASEDLLEDVHELISTQQDGNVLIDEEELKINFDLLVLNILSKDMFH